MEDRPRKLGASQAIKSLNVNDVNSPSTFVGGLVAMVASCRYFDSLKCAAAHCVVLQWRSCGDGEKTTSFGKSWRAGEGLDVQQRSKSGWRFPCTATLKIYTLGRRRH